jgi:hypothetical protein
MAPCSPTVLVLSMGLWIVPATGFCQQYGEPRSFIACGMRPDIVQDLQKRYAERQVSWELTDKDSIRELFASPLGTWSILRTYTSGATCVVRVGHVGPWSDL